MDDQKNDVSRAKRFFCTASGLFPNLIRCCITAMGNAESFSGAEAPGPTIVGAKGLRVLCPSSGPDRLRPCPLPKFAVILSQASASAADPDGDNLLGQSPASVLRVVQAIIAAAAADPSGRVVDLFVESPDRLDAPGERPTDLSPLGVVRRYVLPCIDDAPDAPDTAAAPRRRSRIADFVCPAVAPQTRVHGADRSAVAALITGVAELLAQPGNPSAIEPDQALMALTGLCDAATLKAGLQRLFDQLAKKAAGSGSGKTRPPAVPKADGLRLVYGACQRFASAHPAAAERLIRGLLAAEPAAGQGQVTMPMVTAAEMIARWANGAETSRGMAVVCSESVARLLSAGLQSLGCDVKCELMCRESGAVCAISVPPSVMALVSDLQAMDVGVFKRPDKWRSELSVAANDKPASRPPPFPTGAEVTVRVCGFGRQAVVRRKGDIVGALLDVSTTDTETTNQNAFRHGCPGGDPYLGQISLIDLLRLAPPERRFVSIFDDGNSPAARNVLRTLKRALAQDDFACSVRTFTSLADLDSEGMPRAGCMTVVIGHDVVRLVSIAAKAKAGPDSQNGLLLDRDEAAALTRTAFQAQDVVAGLGPTSNGSRFRAVTAYGLAGLAAAWLGWSAGSRQAAIEAATDAVGRVRLFEWPSGISLRPRWQVDPVLKIPAWPELVSAPAPARVHFRPEFVQLVRTVANASLVDAGALLGPDVSGPGLVRLPTQYNAFAMTGVTDPEAEGLVLRNVTGRHEVDDDRLEAVLSAIDEAFWTVAQEDPKEAKGARVRIPRAFVIETDRGIRLVAEEGSVCERGPRGLPQGTTSSECAVGSLGVDFKTARAPLTLLTRAMLRASVVPDPRCVVMAPGGVLQLRNVALLTPTDSRTAVLQGLLRVARFNDQREVVVREAQELGVTAAEISAAELALRPASRSNVPLGPADYQFDTNPPTGMDQDQADALRDWAEDPRSDTDDLRIDARRAGQNSFVIRPISQGPTAVDSHRLRVLWKKVPLVHVPAVQYVRLEGKAGQVKEFNVRRIELNERPLKDFETPSATLAQAAEELGLIVGTNGARRAMEDNQYKITGIASDGWRILLVDYVRRSRDEPDADLRLAELLDLVPAQLAGDVLADIARRYGNEPEDVRVSELIGYMDIILAGNATVHPRVDPLQQWRQERRPMHELGSASLITTDASLSFYAISTPVGFGRSVALGGRVDGYKHQSLRARLVERIALASDLPLIRIDPVWKHLYIDKFKEHNYEVAVPCRLYSGVRKVPEAVALAEESYERELRGYDRLDGWQQQRLRELVRQLTLFVLRSCIEAVSPVLFPVVGGGQSGPTIDALGALVPSGDRVIGLYRLMTMLRVKGLQIAVADAAAESGLLNQHDLAWLRTMPGSPTPAVPVSPRATYPDRSEESEGRKFALMISLCSWENDRQNAFHRAQQQADIDFWLPHLQASGYEVTLMGDPTLSTVTQQPFLLGSEKNVRAAVQATASRMEKGDRFFIMFTGHGERVSGSQRAKVFLYDTDYYDSEMAGDLLGAEGGDIVVWIHACESAPFVETLSRTLAPDRLFAHASASAFGNGYFSTERGDLLSHSLMKARTREYRDKKFPEFAKLFRVAQVAHYRYESNRYEDVPVSVGNSKAVL